MRGLFGFALSLVLSGVLHAETVTGLVDTTPEELSAQQAAADADLAALRSLLEGGDNKDSMPDGDKAGGHNESGKPLLKRHNKARVDEESFATVLPVSQATQAQQKYQALVGQVQASEYPQQVLPLLDAFVDQYPQHRDARLLLARQYMLAQQLESVLTVLTPLLTPIHRKSHPDWQPWFWAGSAHLALANTEQARDLLEVAVSKDSSRVDIWVQLSVLEQETDNHAGALQYLDIALQLDQNHADIYLNRAYSLEHLGDFSNALKSYQQYLVARSPSVNSVKPTVLRRVTKLAQIAKR